jgi:ATP-dependent Lhr-like helicase
VTTVSVGRKGRTKPAEAWFSACGWQPFPFQKQAWQAHLDGKSLLIHSATGTGKTLAAWLGPLLEWCVRPIAEADWIRVRGKRSAPPLLTLWITPLRALAGDTFVSLQRAVDGMQIPWSLERRTGDTSAGVKQRQRSRLPTALITTPESLTLLLSYPETLGQFGFLRSVIVDEWHELLGSKRGVLLELALARLRRLRPELKVTGLSATLGNLDEAMRVLVGPAFDGPSEIVHGRSDKKLILQAAIPESMERFPWAGHLGTRMGPVVAKEIAKAKTSLIFTNTRNQTELWYQQLLQCDPKLAGQLALHHGSLDTDVRTWVEDSLRDQKLRAVVCTSSLDLGVDFATVDQVVQVGSAKGIARLLQRAGRSGHQPGATARLLFIPTNALELIELAAARRMIRRGRLEAREPIELPLDLLAQHLLTRALSTPYRREELMEELRNTHAFAKLTEEDLEWVIDFAKYGGKSLARYEDYKKLQENEAGVLFIDDPKVARRQRMSIGTIVAEVAIQVRFMTGKKIGLVEEIFISKVKPGERFLLGGRLLELVHVRDSIAWVKKGKGTPTAVPRWAGGRMPLSSQLSQGIREELEAAAGGNFEGVEMQAVQPILKLQQRWSRLPTSQQMLIEQIRTREGFQLFFFPFEGRLVHEGLATVVAHRLSRSRKITFSMAANDYGFVLQSATDPQVDPDETRNWFSEDGLLKDISASLNATEMTRRQFRETARIAGLIHPGFPGEQRSGRHLQASSDLIFDVFCEYDPGNLLLAQARNEVLRNQLEWQRLRDTLDRIAACEIVWTRPAKPTPLAFPLLVDRLRERLSTESLAERIRRMQADLEKAAIAVSF